MMASAVTPYLVTWDTYFKLHSLHDINDVLTFEIWQDSRIFYFFPQSVVPLNTFEKKTRSFGHFENANWKPWTHLLPCMRVCKNEDHTLHNALPD